MEYNFSKKKIKLADKRLTILDKSVIDFLSYINVDYVLVSGYLAILFGRSRSTEDIDLFIKKESFIKFSKLYNRITGSEKYYCINAESDKEAYVLLTTEKSSIRFAEKGSVIPNFEVKFPQNKLHYYALKNKLTAILNNKYKIKISPMELQIAYKLKLGDEKDLEDATHLYSIFKEVINSKELSKFVKKLNIKNSTFKTILGENI